MKLKDVAARLGTTIEAQIYNDRQTGTCGMEAGTDRRDCDESWENWMDEGARVELVAICSIINALTERFDMVVESEKLRVRALQPSRTGVLNQDIYTLSDEEQDGIFLTKEQADQVVCLWRPKGTKVTFDVFDQEWIEEESYCSIPEEFVEETKNENP